MNRHVRLLFGLAASLVLLMTGAPDPAHSDGDVITLEGYQVKMPSQQAIIVWDEDTGREDLILSVELLGSPEAAWVVPVPALPKVQPASADWFEMLAIDTEPGLEVKTKYVYGNCELTVGDQIEVDVQLLSREEVGVYDVSILSADEPGALLDWLNDNGYAFPEEGEPILDAYVEEGGWYFVAARLLPDQSEQLAGTTHPLWFSFDTEQPTYPMRLTALLEGSVDVLIYVLADHRMVSQPHQFSTEFAGELRLYPYPSGINPQFRADNAELADLLNHRPYYVTKLWASHLSADLMAEDLTFGRAESDEPYRAVNYEIRTRCLKEGESPPSEVEGKPPAYRVWLILGVGLGALGVLAALGLVWRRFRREPEEEEEA